MSVSLGVPRSAPVLRFAEHQVAHICAQLFRLRATVSVIVNHSQRGRTYRWRGLKDFARKPLY